MATWSIKTVSRKWINHVWCDRVSNYRLLEFAPSAIRATNVEQWNYTAIFSQCTMNRTIYRVTGKRDQNANHPIVATHWHIRVNTLLLLTKINKYWLTGVPPRLQNILFIRRLAFRYLSVTSAYFSLNTAVHGFAWLVIY